ncbi:MAG: hypothetical protein GXP10_04475 [Gammaproteobacteria bacterium]|nr:hypothetical protein [Gammaproteobacteria bacterium]
MTDSTGSGAINVTYSKEFAAWVTVKLEATVSEAGIESSTSTIFVLPVLAADLLDENIAPPGMISPYGTVASCADPN